MTYDLKSVQLPRLAGMALSAFVELAENPLTRPALLGQLLESGGIANQRKLVIDDAPTPQPMPPTEGPAWESEETQAEARRQTWVQEKPARSDPPGQEPFRYPSAGDYSAAYRRGALTPLQVAERALAAIEQSQSGGLPMNTFVAWRAEDLLEQARASTQRWQAGQPFGPLDGVPVAVKDEVDLRGFPTTVGTCFLGSTPAANDSSVAARMRTAGALLLGKVNMHEIGIGVTGHNTHHGVARNPQNPAHHTGGSSSGPGAAVAAGFCPIAIGADGGGSIRLPSSFCGVVGLKPTFGRISEHGAAPLCWSVAPLGPLAATAHDAALGLAIMAGPDPSDSNSLGRPFLPAFPLKDAASDLSDLRMGVYWPWFRHAAAEVVAACESMLAQLQTMGAQVVEIDLPELEAARVAHVITITGEMNASLDRYYATHHRQYSLEVRLDLALARSFTSADYIKSQQVRTRTIRHFEQALRQVDVILTPSAGVAAPPIRPDSLPAGDSDLSLLTEIMRFATPANFTGHPAISFPAGYTAAGLPVGMQAIGRYWREDTLLRLAAAAESRLPRRRPQVFYDLLS